MSLSLVDKTLAVFPSYNSFPCNNDNQLCVYIFIYIFVCYRIWDLAWIILCFETRNLFRVWWLENDFSRLVQNNVQYLSLSPFSSSFNRGNYREITHKYATVIGVGRPEVIVYTSMCISIVFFTSENLPPLHCWNIADTINQPSELP